MQTTADSVLADRHAAPPIAPDNPIRYPGEQTLATREENLRVGIPVDDALWQQLLTQSF